MLACELLRILSVLALFTRCIGKEKIITVSSFNCNITYTLDDDDEYILEYRGESNLSSCKYTFVPDSLSVQLCVKAKKFDVSCQLKVMYRFEMFMSKEKSYTCGQNVEDSCEFATLLVEFNKDSSAFANDHVILKINGTADTGINDFAMAVVNTVYMIIGVIIAVIVLIIVTIVVVVCCCCVHRQRRSRGQIYHPPQAAVAIQMPGQAVPQPVFQPAPGYELLQQPAQLPYLPCEEPMNPHVEYVEPSSYPPPPKGSFGYQTIPTTVPDKVASAPGEANQLPPPYPGN